MPPVEPGRRARSPLPVRDGLNATRLVLPHDPVSTARFTRTLDYVLHRFPGDAERLAVKVAAGEVVDGRGRPVTARTPYEPRGFVFLYRDPPVEPEVPFEIAVLHRDENLLVVDKPHFLASIPRGAFVARSALVRLRRDLDLPELSPAHRLDRVTAGVLVLTVRPEVRGAYQELFARREVRKEYEAVAPFDPALALPCTVRSRIHKERGVMRATEVPGEPNAESHVELVDVRGTLGRYRLRPHTGKTHQLRLHMNRLGVPILHDNFYPEPYDVAPDDYSRPLQLVSRSVEFTDPLSGRPRLFATDRRLDAWG
ncbi:pseudouridine synthase [Oerskovia flava]|uniref:pseudouridine synthase n=1 Tax=Oerskovia flava TaxID=2986422 RepID=UPI0022409973|nr:pseudouridine synthase [Oerskovia sp. JB1-3-2]